MRITEKEQLAALHLDQPWYCAQHVLAENHNLAITQNGKTRLLASRHVSGRHDVGWTTPNAIQNTFAVSVHMAAREGYDFFFGTKHCRRARTSAGAIGITDLRIISYADLRNRIINNIQIYVPLSALNELTEEHNACKIDELEDLTAENRLDPTLYMIAKILEPALARPAEANVLFLDHIYAATCAHVAQKYGALSKLRSLRRGGLTSSQRKHATGILLARLQDPPNLQELAASCSLSRSHFIKAFKESTGLPPHRWLLAERVKQAKHLLNKGQLSIAQIALDCGFADQSHLTRVFSKSVGLSPTAWRRARES